MGTYTSILAKQADVYYKQLLVDIAKVNELNETNRLKRIELAIKVKNLDPQERANIEGEIGEELDLSDVVNAED